MIGALAADQLRARGVTTHAVVRKRNLECRFHGLGAGVGEEHMVQPRRGDLDDGVRQLERERMAHLERWGVVHGLELVRDGFHDLRAAMARVDAPQPRDPVQDLAPLGRPVVHPRGPGQDPRLRFELAIGRKRHPMRFELVAGGG